MRDRNRDLLARVAVPNPHLAGPIMRLCDELQDGELPDPPLLREYGAHVRDLGELITARADALAATPAPVVIDAGEP